MPLAIWWTSLKCREAARVQPPGILTLKATAEELQAAGEVLSAYVAYLESGVSAGAERSVVIAQVHHLHLRFLSSPLGEDGFIKAHLSVDEAAIFGHAFLMYQELLRMRPDPFASKARGTLRLVSAMQQRFLKGNRQLQ